MIRNMFVWIFSDVNHDETVEVEYVDYGNTEVISFKDVKKIPDMYLKLPKQVRSLSIVKSCILPVCLFEYLLMMICGLVFV